MSNGTYNSLIEGHVYRFCGLLLEAAHCDVWTLNLLTERGEYVPVEHGALIAYELRADGSWDTVHYSFEPLLLPGGEVWTFSYGDRVEIGPAQLVPVANRRSDVEGLLREQEQQFREIMAAMDW